jgi:hypothetical protein
LPLFSLEFFFLSLCLPVATNFASALSVLTNRLCFLGLVLLLENGAEFSGRLVFGFVASKMGSGYGGVLAFKSRPSYLRTRKETYQDVNNTRRARPVVSFIPTLRARCNTYPACTDYTFAYQAGRELDAVILALSTLGICIRNVIDPGGYTRHK